MLFLLSPAKTQRSEVSFTAPSSASLSSPEFLSEANVVAEALASLPTDKLRSLLNVSAAIGEIAATRTRSFAMTASLSPAVFVFDGPAYRSLDAASLTKEGLVYLQSSLCIICPLYGALRPLDAIKNYRLEMNSKLNVGAFTNLYLFWGEKVAKAAVRRALLSSPTHPTIVNVASEEYAVAVLKHAASLSGVRVVNVRFPGASVHAKAARGAIVRYAAVHGLQTVEGLRAFTGSKGELRFDEKATTKDNLVFIRTKSGAGAEAGAGAGAGAEEEGMGESEVVEGKAAPNAKKAVKAEVKKIVKVVVKAVKVKAVKPRVKAKV